MDFFQRYKKILLIIAFLLFCTFLGYIMYRLFFKPLGTEKPGPTATSTPIGTEFPSSGTSTGGNITTNAGQEGNEANQYFPEIDDIAQGGFTKTETIYNKAAKGVKLSQDGNTLKFYDQSQGKFYKIDKDGNTLELSDKIFHDAQEIDWSNTSNQAIIEYPDGANILYNFDSNKQVTLPSHWEGFNFAPGSEQVVSKSLGMDEDNRWLIVSNDDGTRIKAIESLGFNDKAVTPSWSPNKEVVAVYTGGNNFNEQELYFIGLNGENFKSTTLPGRGFEGIWSPKGDKMLYSVYSTDSDYKPELWTVGAQGEKIGSNRKKIGLNTWAKKCTFVDDEEVVCAVPRNLQPGSGIMTDMRAKTVDDLYRINTRTSLKKLLAIPDGNYNIDNILLSENGFYLYFTDTAEQNLHKIKLK